MAYTVLCDNKLLHDPTLQDNTIILFAPTLTEEANAASTFEFTIYPNNNYYNDIDLFKSVIEVYEDGTLIFRGRPLNESRGWNNEKTITCESDLAFLCDSIVRTYEYTGSVSGYLSMLITQHNNQVETNKRFTVRNVTVTDPNDNIVRANENYPNTFEEIREKLVDILGGYLIVSRSGSTNYLDYLADSPYVNLQHIELGQNLLDYSEELHGEDIATVLVPLGAKDEGGGERITIESVNQGKDYIEDATAVAAYGRIVKMETWDDVTLPTNLLTKARARLSELVQGRTSISLSAVDLSPLYPDMRSFKVMQYVDIVDDYHDITGQMLILGKTTDLTDPANNTITVGREFSGLTKHTEDTAGKVQTIIADYVLNKQLRVLKADIEENTSRIQQTAEQILTEVASKYVTSDGYETKITELTSSIEQTAEATIEQYNELNILIDEAGGALDAYKEEVSTFIRHDVNGITIGRSDSEFKTVLSNDKLSFVQGSNEVAYISDHKLYITEANITDRLVLGHFQWIVEDNGSLSFVYVEDGNLLTMMAAQMGD